MAKMNKTLSEMNKILSDVNKQLKRMDEVAEIDKINKETEKLNKTLKKTKRSYEEIDKVKKRWMDRKAARALAKEYKSLGGGTSKVVSEMEDAKNHTQGLWKALRSGSPKAVRQQAIHAAKFSEEMKKSSAYAAKMPGALGAAGKAGLKLAGSLGAVSKVMSGPVGWGLAVGQAVVSAAMSVDTYVKDLNKKFAMVRGPSMLTDDVAQQFKDYNSAIFNIQHNLQDALQPEEVQIFAESVTAAGVRVTSLMGDVNSFRDVVGVAAKASKVFGMDIQATGSYMTTMMAEQKMGLKEIDSAFKQVSFDAAKSGFSTDKFMNAIVNASSAMSFFGTFLKGASKNLKTFVDTGVVGMEESVQASTELTKAFSQGSLQSKMGFIEMAGVANKVRDSYTKLARKYSTQAGDLESKIQLAVNAGNDEEASKLRKEQLRYNRLSGQAQMASQGSLVTLADNMGMLADDSPGYFLDLIKVVSNGANLSLRQNGATNEIIRKGVAGIAKEMNISEKTIWELKETATAAAQNLIAITENGKILNKLNEDQKTSLKSLDENTDIDTVNNLTKSIAETLEIDKESAGILVKSMAADEKLRNLINTSIEKGDTATLSTQINDLIKSGEDIGTNYMQYLYKLTEASDKKMEEGYNKQFDEIRLQTLSAKDMADIASKGVKWNVAMLTGVVDISKNVAKIAGLRLRDAKNETSTSVLQGTAVSSGYSGAPSGGWGRGWASGVNTAPGGLSLVGERGPELVNLPTGSQVVNAGKTRSLMSFKGSGKGETKNISVSINVNATEKDLAQRIANGVRGVLYEEQLLTN